MNRRDFIAGTAVALAASSVGPQNIFAADIKADGMNYAPQGKPNAVVKPGEFVIAAAHLDHAHIYGMCNGLTEAGAIVKWVFDPDPKKVAAFREKFPQAKAAR